MTDNPKFEKETDLCNAFIKALPDGWVSYNETGGFDILLVRASDDFQIGIEAKLRLNAKVITQAAEYLNPCHADNSGPDCRAVLIPEYVSGDLAEICRLVGIEVIRMRHPDHNPGWSRGHGHLFDPELPGPNSRGHYAWREEEGVVWPNLMPHKRITLPDWVPDTCAGDKCPVTLTGWKIRAIKIAVMLEKTGYVTRKDFAELDISMSRWTQGRWLKPSESYGQWIKGPNFPDFRKQHPVNFEQIAGDFSVWNPRKLPRGVA
jgi:hypothetical protein